MNVRSDQPPQQSRPVRARGLKPSHRGGWDERDCLSGVGRQCDLECEIGADSLGRGSRAFHSAKRWNQRSTPYLNMAWIALGGLVVNAIWGFSWADPLAALAVTPLIVREGWQALTCPA